MKVYSVLAGNFKLDGGAMFGVVPKSLWTRTNPADENNKIELTTRCLLIKNGDRLTLIDTGMGNKQSEKFFSYYFLYGDDSLVKSLAKHGFHPDDITDVFLTHLHFDHSGGAVNWNADKTGYELAFKNATYWSNKSHWEWATKPNRRERASFLKENILPIEESGQLKFIEEPKEGNFTPAKEMDFGLWFMNGHTDKQMLPHFDHNGKTFVYVADLLPTVGHLPTPFVMGYDTRPLLTVHEKEAFLNKAAEEGYYLILGHDPHNEIITVQHTEKGVRLKETYTSNQLF